MNTNEARTYLIRISESLTKQKIKFLTAGAKFAEGLLKDRVFGQGQDSKKASLGDYKSKSWKSKRSKAGKQIAYKDLHFRGDLMNSIVTGKDKGEAVVYINNDKKYLIARGQEEQIGRIKGAGVMDIWNLSEDEEKLVQDYVEELIMEELDKL